MHLFTPITIAIAVLLPFIAALAWGRRLRGSRGEPGLSDRWLAYVRAQAMVGMFCGVYGVLMAPGAALPIALAILLGSAAGSLPARRTVFEETWGLGAYLGHVLRFPVAIAAFWILVAVAPGTIAAAGALQAPVAVAFGLLLLSWSFRFAPALSWVMGARPVEAAALGGRLQQIVARSKLAGEGPGPILLRAGAPGGTWTGLLALPAARPRLIVADTLIEKLDLDELGALFGHAVASLEGTRGARVRWSTLLSVLLIAGAVLSVPLVGATLGPAAVGWVHLIWLAFVLTAFSRTVSRVNRDEVACDRRAVELCGDPEALIRALAKLHALSRLPTRWDSEFEKAMSHPGLASRIETIRQAAGLATPTFDEEVVLASSEPGRFAILGPEQASFLEGVGEGDLDPAGLRQRAASSRAYAYRSLVEAEVKVRIGGAATLRATTLDGHKLQMPLHPASVAPAQKALDAADAKLGRQAAETAPLVALAGVAALVVLVGAFTPGMVGAIAVPALLVLFRQHVAPILAAGTMAVGASLLAIATADGSTNQSWTVIGLPLVLLFGLHLISLARRLARTRTAPVWRDFGATVALLVAGGSLTLPLAIDDFMALGCDLGSSRQTTAPLFALSLAVLLVARYRRRRAARPPAAG